VQAVEQRAAGVGVDLDQPRPVRTDVEVVAHEDGEVARGVAGHLGCPRVDEALPGLAVRDAERRGDGAADRVEVPRGEGHQRPRVRDFRR
jgi:hypothetical protein